MPDPYINYRITKTAENTYEMKFVFVEEGTKQLQTNIVVEKTDADGTITVEKNPIPTMSLVNNIQYGDNYDSGEIANGFYCNLDTSNVGIGGTVYEIESTVGYYEP